MDEWPLMSTTTAWSLTIAYVTFATMAPRAFVQTPPMRPVLLTMGYNLVQIMLCSYMCVEAAVRAKRAGYTLVCNPISYDAPVMADLVWLFYVSKLLDFCDTVFIVLAKRWRQLSFLHVYHHSTVFLFYWLNAHYNFDGDVYLTIVLNGGVHVIMYIYYMVAMHTQTIWWKPYLTVLQIVQFVLMISHAATMLYRGESCSNLSPTIMWMYFGYIVTMLCLFSLFFVDSYTNKPPKRL